MSSLFDKLTKMSAPAPEPPPPPPPAAPPASLKDDVHSPRDPRARAPGSPSPLSEKLRSVGAGESVNPPAPARAPAPPPPGPSAPAPGASAPPPPGPSAPAPAGECPHCHQTFKVLSRHRCKGAAAPSPAPSPAPAPGPRKLYCAFCGEEISDLPSHMAGCARAPGAAPASSPEPVAAPAPAPEPVSAPAPAPAPEPEPSFHGFGPEQPSDPRYPETDPKFNGPEPGPFTRAADDVLRRTPAQHIDDLTAGKVTESSALDGYVLFLDAIFEKNEFDANGLKHFTDIVFPLAEAVARENRVGHWGAVEYNRGGALLAGKLEGWIKHVNPVGVILADGTTPECRACKEVLKRYAKVIVQGIR